MFDRLGFDAVDILVSKTQCGRPTTSQLRGNEQRGGEPNTVSHSEWAAGLGRQTIEVLRQVVRGHASRREGDASRWWPHLARDSGSGFRGRGRWVPLLDGVRKAPPRRFR